MLYGRTELCEEREARRLLAEHEALGEELWRRGRRSFGWMRRARS